MVCDKKKVLLIEPNYSNKYPPIGLMKLATYYRNRGDWEVTFFKGDLKQFVIERIADRCIEEFVYIDETIDWRSKRDAFINYIKTRKSAFLDSIPIESSEMELILFSKIHQWKDFYWCDTWKQCPEWDRVAITTLFTFYWKITVDTINFAKWLVKDISNLMVGGVLASIQPREIEAATGIKPWVGILGHAGDLDDDDTQIIDNLPLDYSILDEIDYTYPMANAFYGYMTRGCIRHCPFCAVPTLEPNYVPYIPLKERIEKTREQYGDQKDLLLMDNNVLASDNFTQIIEDIVQSGFGAGATFIQPNLLDIAVRNLESGVNNRAYLRKCQLLIADFYDKIKHEKNKSESYHVYKAITENRINKLATTTREGILQAYTVIGPIYKRHHRPVPRRRTVDFNQGVDARLFTEEKVAQLARIAIRPLRIAFDHINTRSYYENAVRLSAKYGIKEFSNYLLYNFTDQPVDLYKRLRINIDLCEELQVNIYSFPMKYHPLSKLDGDIEDFSHNRDYIGKHWNRKYIRAVQAILNSTKGKIGRGVDFFEEAFGHDEREYLELLEMPETFILYRFFFKWLEGRHEMCTSAWRCCWHECMTELSNEEKERLLSIIHHNEFSPNEVLQLKSAKAIKLMDFYVNCRKDIITPGSVLYNLKQEYDNHPTIKMRKTR